MTSPDGEGSFRVGVRSVTVQECEVDIWRVREVGSGKGYGGTTDKKRNKKRHELSAEILSPEMVNTRCQEGKSR